MPNLWDKTTEVSSPTDLNPPDLNPLTNPVLEKNLGRWAKVYFSTPPAKREQAVISLLEELKRESGGGSNVEPVRPYFARQPKFQSAVCAACQRQNPPGHKYCSRCGEPLESAQGIGAQPNATQSAVTERAVTENSSAARPFEAQLPYPSPNSSNDARWLQDRAFGSLDGFDAEPRRGWKYLAVAAVIVLAGFAYVQWSGLPLSRLTSSSAPQANSPAPQPALNSPPAEIKTSPEAIAPAATPLPKAAEVVNPPAKVEAKDRTTPAEGIQPASQKSALSVTISRQPLAEGGVAELRLAQRYLGGSMGVRDSSEAAKLLWKAVSKQNTTAAVLLSGLYLRGDGVPRSCDQARLLLVAAAKRGAPEAAQPLRNLESQGCR